MGEGFVVAAFLIVLVPAMVVMLALPIGLRWRAPDPLVRAVYLFHRSGEPVAMVASDRLAPFAAKDLEPIVGSVRDFAEAGFPARQGSDVTSLRFDEESLVGVRGVDVNVCAILRGQSTAEVRRDLIQFIRAFEGRNEGRLDTWQDACRFAGEATDALSPLLAAA